MLTWIALGLVVCTSPAVTDGVPPASVGSPAVCAAADDAATSSSAGVREEPTTTTPPAGKAHKGESKDEKATKKNVDTTRVQWKQHPSFRVGSAFRLDVKAMLEEDAHASQVGEADLDPLRLHQTRIGVSGNIYKRVEFEVERELSNANADPTKPQKTPWKDVYVNVSAIRSAQVQLGRFKIPFGRDELSGPTQNWFVYRSLGARYLAPARDVGGMVHGRLFDRGLGYWVGAFVHDGDHSRSSKMQGADRTLAARVVGRPFRPLGLGSIELGTAVAVSSLSDESFEPNGLRGRTVLTRDTFFRSVYVNGLRRRVETDVDWTAGRASARAEVTWVGDGRQQQGMSGEDLPDARARAWYIAGGWTVVGGRKKKQAGVQLVGRVERLWFDSAGASIADELSRSPRAQFIMPSGNRALTLGANWTINRWVKLQLNGIREQVEDAERSPDPDGAAFWSRAFRLQLSL